MKTVLATFLLIASMAWAQGNHGKPSTPEQRALENMNSNPAHPAERPGQELHGGALTSGQSSAGEAEASHDSGGTIHQNAADAHAESAHGGASSEHGDSIREIPKTVGYQAFNFFGLLIILAVLLKGKIGGYFSGRHEKLAQAVKEARQAQEEAARRHQDYQVRLQTLERHADTQLEEMKREGEEYRKRLIEEAKLVAQNIEVEARKTAANEVQKAKLHLREEVLAQSLELARSSLSKTVVEKDQQRLQKEFVDKIQAVQQ